MKIFWSIIVVIMFLAIMPGKTPEPDRPKPGEPDKLGSWGQINQRVARSEDWEQIVTDSPFQLGEKRYKGSWQQQDGSQDYYEIEFGTYPSIDGSTVALPMAVEFARQHLNFSDEDANDFAGFNTTNQAYVNLITKEANTMGMIRSEFTFLDENHPVDIIIVTEPSDEELDLAEEHHVELIQKPVCYDAFVFITHKNNPVDSLTVEQIRGIYSGKITNWREVGGDNAPITAYQREVNSGSQTAMLNLVMKDTPMLPPEMIAVHEGMGALIEAVAEYQNNSASIGYTYKYYIDNLYKNEQIKILKVDGISADEENIRMNRYPFSTYYYGVIRSSDEDAVGGDFLAWMLSEEGQRCIRQAGYIPYVEY